MRQWLASWRATGLRQARHMGVCLTSLWGLTTGDLALKNVLQSCDFLQRRISWAEAWS